MLEMINVGVVINGEEGKVQLIKDINLTLQDKKIYVMTGPNGGGKSCIAKAIMGIYQPTSGQILLDGLDITHRELHERARLGIGYAFQQPARFKGIKVRDLLTLAAGDNKQINLCGLLYDVGLCAQDYLDREINASFSGGEVKRIEIATILARNLKVAIFDEPEAGIDLWSFQRLTETFEKMNEKYDTTIVIISHQERILNLADEVILVADRTIREITSRQKILGEIGQLDSACRCRQSCSRGGGEQMLDAVDKKLLAEVADLHDIPSGAFNIRKNGQGVERHTTVNINIETKKDKPGINVTIKAGTKGESVHIPVILSEGMDDLVYNTFEIGENADVLIVAGCGIHNPSNRKAQHGGIHEFFVRKGARMKYVEKHYGEGEGSGARILNPKTIIEVEDGATAELEMVQIRGINNALRETEVSLHKNARLIMTERLLTYLDQTAESNITVHLLGDDATAQVISRSVAQNDSKQLFHLNMRGYARCRGHIQCDSIIMDQAEVSSIPEITAFNSDAQLIHEAAIGKIASEQLTKLMSFGLTEKEAEETILQGFLK